MTRHQLTVFSLIFTLLAFGLVTSVAAAQSIELRLPDGSRWRGEVGDQVKLTERQRNVEVEYVGRITEAANLYLQIEGNFVGGTRTIFKADILSITTIRETDRESGDQPVDRPAAGRRDRDRGESDYTGPGVIVLPLNGMVGIGIRREEFREVGKEADRLGPGQIIVLKIDTGGGMLLETFEIASVMQEIKQRHRLIAWVNPRAISAGCAIASLCHEIYFTRDGSAGAMTAYSGADMKSLDDENMERWIRNARRWMESGGHDPLIAEAMILADRELSYDKDPETGRVTFYGNLSGKHILSRRGENLTLTAHDAVSCGFANGIANTHEELAELLDLPKWYEVSDYGRRIHSDWMSTIERAENEIPRLIMERNRGVTLQRERAIIQEFLRWLDRAPNVAMYQFGIGPKQELERQEREIRRQIAEQRRGGR